MNRRLIGVVVVLGVSVGLATACTGSSGSESAAMPRQAQDAGGAGDSGSTGEGRDQATAGDGEVSQPGVDRRLVRTATIELEARDISETVDHARDIAATEGGYAGSEEVRKESGTLTLHIPSDRFDHALDELSALGTVTSRNQSAEDVTEQVVDLDSRIATQRASVDRVRALLAKASTVDEIVRIEQEVTTRESDLESLERRRQVLAGQVAMSTVTINVSKTSPPQRQDESGGFLSGLSDGWRAFLDTGSVTLQVFGAVLPFAPALAVIALLAIRWWRRHRTTEAAVQQP
jgi:hypothetical protein